MQPTDILSVERINSHTLITSKKRVLEQISDLIADSYDLNQNEIFDSLLTRERLGSTGIGRGVAIPHGRVRNCTQPIGALLHMVDGIDYESPDHQPVYLVFGLLVPEESQGEHLQLLARLAEMFRDPKLVTQLRAAPDADTLLSLIHQWQDKNPPNS